MNKHGKKYIAMSDKVTQEKYSLTDAAKLVKETSSTKFDATIEVHVNLTLNTKHADQQLRTTVNLPHGTGKTKNIVAFVEDDMIQEALDAGATEAGNENLIAKVKEGWTDFDVAVAHPTMMKEMGKLGKILGTKGLMPNPKAGTVTAHIGKAIKELMGGRVELKADAHGIVHTIAGKVSFDADKIEENIKTILQTIKSNKPKGSKGAYVKTISISASMGPSVVVDNDEMK